MFEWSTNRYKERCLLSRMVSRACWRLKWNSFSYLDFAQCVRSEMDKKENSFSVETGARQLPVEGVQRIMIQTTLFSMSTVSRFAYNRIYLPMCLSHLSKF